MDTRFSALVFLLFYGYLWICGTNFNVSNINRYGYDLFNVVEEGSTTFYLHICGLRFSPGRKNLAPHGYHSSRIPRSLWSSRGYTSLLVPGHDPPQDIAIFMDVALNPGPNLSSAQFVANTNASLWDDQYGDSDSVMNFALPSNGLKIIHLNVSSLGNKVELIRILLLSRSLDILALTETWLDETWNDKEIGRAHVWTPVTL